MHQQMTVAMKPKPKIRCHMCRRPMSPEEDRVYHGGVSWHHASHEWFQQILPPRFKAAKTRPRL